MYRCSPFRSTLNTSYITRLYMCEVCTVTSHVWTCVKYVPKQVRTCVKYVPKQSILGFSASAGNSASRLLGFAREFGFSASRLLGFAREFGFSASRLRPGIRLLGFPPPSAGTLYRRYDLLAVTSAWVAGNPDNVTQKNWLSLMISKKIKTVLLIVRNNLHIAKPEDRKFKRLRPNTLLTRRIAILT